MKRADERGRIFLPGAAGEPPAISALSRKATDRGSRQRSRRSYAQRVLRRSFSTLGRDCGVRGPEDRGSDKPLRAWVDTNLGNVDMGGLSGRAWRGRFRAEAAYQPNTPRMIYGAVLAAPQR